MKRRTKEFSRYFEVIIGALFVIISLAFGYNFFEKEGIGLEESPYSSVQENNDIEKTEFESLDTNLKIHFVDQTTTNMIQRISHLFAINPLISKEI